MRKLKKVGIALLIFIFVLVIATTIALWYIFTPEKLTPLVNEQAKDFLSCNTIIEKVEPTFFSTYPFFGIELTNLCLKENTDVSKIDTILYAPKCFASINLMSYLSDGNIGFDPLLIEGGYLNFKIDSNGQSNFDIIKNSSDSTDTDTTAFAFGDIDISNVEFKNFNAKYTDESSLSKVDINNLNASLELKYNKLRQWFEMDMQLDHLQYQTLDSTALFVDVRDCSLKINSKSKDENLFGSNIGLTEGSILFSMAGDTILSEMKIDADVPFNYNLAQNSCGLNKATLVINNEQEVVLNGHVKLLKDNSVSTDIKYSTSVLDIEKIIALIPKAYSEPLEGLSAKGFAQLSGSIAGLLTDTLMPLVNTNIEYNKGEIKYSDYPSIKDIQLSVSTKIDMNTEQSSDLTINRSYAKIKRSYVSVKGDISDMLENPNYDIYLDGAFNLSDFEPYIPEDQNVNFKGLLNGQLHTRFLQSDLDQEAYHRIYLTSNFETKDFYAIYDDSMKVDLPLAGIKLYLPSQSRVDKNLKLANIKIEAPKLNLEMSPTMQAATEKLELSVDINNLEEGASVPIISCQYKVGSLYAKADTLSVEANNADGQLKYVPTLQDKQEIAIINSTINSQQIGVASKGSVLFDAKELYAKTNLKYDDSQINAIDQWHPDVAISFKDAVYDLGERLKGQVLNMSCTLNPEVMAVEKIDLTIGDSDYGLSGELSNISKYLNGKGLLKGDFNLVSENTDVFELMDIFDGIGSQDSTLAGTEAVSSESDPFMVPKGVEIRLNTSIGKTVVNDNVIENIKGGLTVKDGTLILDQMGFTSKAAHMQLTAMYRSDRKNHLFTGIDFHLLDINIAELIDLIPSVDQMIPMLKSFKGRGEFHLAGEAYLKSDYSLKQSTIRGAAAFQGQELTIMDTETFDMIASKLQFKKRTENVIDSLSVEMTLFKDEIDLYPFLVVMDNYKAVISGRHTMDNRFNYHISVTDTPLPVRLGLDIGGTMENLEYKLVPCQYKHLYNPKKQGALEERTLRLKKLISESLKENVKPIK